MTKHVAVYPGSFNPFHPGHLHVVAQAALLFDKVTVLIATNPEKSYRVSPQERKELILHMVEDFVWAKNVAVDITDKPLMEYCNKKRIPTVVRGVRNGDDLEYERAQREYNMRLGQTDFPISYVYLAPDMAMQHLSSTYVRNFVKYCSPLQLCSLYNSTVLQTVLGYKEAAEIIELYKE